MVGICGKDTTEKAKDQCPLKPDYELKHGRVTVHRNLIFQIQRENVWSITALIQHHYISMVSSNTGGKNPNCFAVTRSIPGIIIESA